MKPDLEPWHVAPPAASRAAVAVARGQGLFFVVTGVWPLLHLRSFLAVTGPKTDLWLVQTAGALIAVAGVGLLAAARHGRVPAEWKLFGALFSAALAAVDIVYVARHVIGPVYLADAAVEGFFVIAWLAVARR